MFKFVSMLISPIINDKLSKSNSQTSRSFSADERNLEIAVTVAYRVGYRSHTSYCLENAVAAAFLSR